jgi:predicted amidohydrolase
MAREHEHFRAGDRRVIVTLKGWRVLLLVCYDLRFPVWSRNGAGQGALDYDLAVVVANWPTPRRTPWRTLLRARAMENLACVAGLNRVGTDGQGHPYAGDSVLLDALGEPLVEGGPEVAVLQATLDPARLLAHRERFPAWRDADGFELR